MSHAVAKSILFSFVIITLMESNYHKLSGGVNQDLESNSRPSQRRIQLTPHIVNNPNEKAYEERAE